jgi:hypothetical protein
LAACETSERQYGRDPKTWTFGSSSNLRVPTLLVYLAFGIVSLKSLWTQGMIGCMSVRDQNVADGMLAILSNKTTRNII